VVGATPFVITASDGTDTADSNEFTITVTDESDPNDPPVFGTPPIADESVTIGTAIAPKSGNFTDPDGDVLTYTISPAVAGSGLSFSTSTGVLSGTPNAVDSVTYTISASDGTLSTPSNQFTITVVADTVNLPPVLNTDIADQAVIVGNAITDIVPDFSDPEGDVLTYTITPNAATAGLTFAQDTGTLSGEPDAVADFSFVLTASDGINTTPSNSFTISVSVGNAAPVAGVTVPDLTTTVGNSVSIDGEFTDQDGDTLTYSIDPPSALAGTGLSLSSTGILAGIPTAEATLVDIAIVANDGTVDGRTNEFTITINPEIIENQPPVQIGTVDDLTITIGDAMDDVTPVFEDPENEPLTVTISPDPTDGFVFADGTLSGTPTAIGEYEFTFTASDGELTVDSNTFKITVKSAGISPPGLPQ